MVDAGLLDLVGQERVLGRPLQGLGRPAVGGGDDDLFRLGVGPQHDGLAGALGLAAGGVAGVAEGFHDVGQEHREAQLQGPIRLELLVLQQREGDDGIDEAGPRRRERQRAGAALDQDRRADGGLQNGRLLHDQRGQVAEVLRERVGEVPVQDHRELGELGRGRVERRGDRAEAEGVALGRFVGPDAVEDDQVEAAGGEVAGQLRGLDLLGGGDGQVRERRGVGRLQGVGQEAVAGGDEQHLGLPRRADDGIRAVVQRQAVPHVDADLQLGRAPLGQVELERLVGPRVDRQADGVDQPGRVRRLQRVAPIELRLGGDGLAPVVVDAAEHLVQVGLVVGPTGLKGDDRHVVRGDLAGPGDGLGRGADDDDLGLDVAQAEARDVGEAAVGEDVQLRRDDVGGDHALRELQSIEVLRGQRQPGDDLQGVQQRGRPLRRADPRQPLPQ